MSNTYYQHEWSYSPRDSRITWAVQTLILANVIVFAGQLLVDMACRGIPGMGGIPGAPGYGIPGGQFLGWLSFRTTDVMHRGWLWQLITYMFLHGGLMHVSVNMLWLFVFGPDVERLLGSRQFLGFYFLCGAVGVLANFIPAAWYNRPYEVIGASGAVMGVLIAYAVANPERQFYFFPFPFPINARAIVFIVIAVNIVTAMSGGTTSVATHFGGMVVGYAYMKLVPIWHAWQNQRDRLSRPKRDPLDEIGEAVDNIFKFDRKRTRRK